MSKSPILPNSTILINIGRRIKLIRKDKGISQIQLAIISGFDKTTISKIELGKINVTIKSLAKISVALDIKIYMLF